MCGGDIGYIKTLHDGRGMRQEKRIRQGLKIPDWIDRGRQRATCEASSWPGRAAKIVQHIAHLGRLLKFKVFRRLFHLLLDLFEHLVALTFKKLAGCENSGFIIIEGYASDAGRRAVFDDVI